MYSAADGNNLPEGSYLTFAEIGLVTAPGSQVPQIYRWEASTYQQAVDNGDPPNIIGEMAMLNFLHR